MTDANPYDHAVLAEFLDDAADILDQRGHCRGSARDRQGHVCAVGAMDVAAATHRITKGYTGRFTHEAAIQVESHLKVGGLVEWNDHVAADGAEVAQTFRDTATKIRPDQTGSTLP